MKKLYIITCIVLLALASCNDFLEEEPRSSISLPQYFSSEDDASAAVNNLYRIGVPSFFDAGDAYMGPIVAYGGYMSGFFDNEYKGQEEFVQDCQSLTLDATANNSVILGLWEGCYSAISRANTIVRSIPDISGISETNANKLLAETRFFRALNYFYLVKMFGGVPLITEPYESLENLYIAKSSETDIYNFIIKDLEFAIDSGGLNNAPMPQNDFRISKGSVMSLLADVYLNVSGYPVLDNKYSEAADIAKQLITNGSYSLVENGSTLEESAYRTICTSDNESEYLYVIEYDNSIKNGGWRPAHCFPNIAATWGEFQYSICCNTYRPVSELLKIYDFSDDIRAQEKQYLHSYYIYTSGTNEGDTVRFDTSPYFWFESDALYNTAISQKDQCYYRLAEMYLIAAEAIAKTEGVTSEAAGYLAKIKARASMSKSENDILSELINLSVDDFVSEVWKERIREFILENKIWNDITRTRKYPSVDNDDNFTFIDFIGAPNPWGKSFAEKNLLLPIPDDEIQRNPELKQNTGY